MGLPSFTLSTPERIIWVMGLMVATASTFSLRWLWRWPQKALDPYMLLYGVVTMVLLAPLLMRLYVRVEGALSHLPRPWQKWPRPVRLVLWGVIAAGVVYGSYLYLFDIRPSRFYGDAGAVVGFVKKGVLFHKREPLSPAIFLGMYTWLGGPVKVSAMSSVQITTSIAGAFGVWALLGIARHLVPGRPLLVGAAFAALISVGSIQLFAGYIENYTVPTVFALWAVYLGLRALHLGGSVLPSAALFTLACATHLSMLSLGPAMAWLVYVGHYRRDLRRVMHWRTLALLAVTILPAVALWMTMESMGYHRSEEEGFGGGDGLMFVPWSEKTGMSQYTFFSEKHLKAIANIHGLVAPMALVVVLAVGGSMVAMWWRRRRQGVSEEGLTSLVDGALPFLVLTGMGHLALTIVWNPDLGPKRDWDLYGPVGFYLSVGAVALLVRRYPPPRAFALLCLVVAVNLTRTLPFLLHNLRR